MYVAKSLVNALISFALAPSEAQKISQQFEIKNINQDPKEDKDWVTLEVYNQIWETLLQQTQNEWLGWECGARFDILSTGLTGYIIRHSPDVRTALIKITQYSKLLSNLVTYDVKPADGSIQVNFSSAEQWQQQSPEAVQQEEERIMSFMIQGLATLTGKPFTAETILIKRPPVKSNELDQVAHKVTYHASQNAFVFAPEVLQLPLIDHNDQLLQVLEGHAQQILLKLQPTTFADTIRKTIIDHFQQHQHFAQIEGVAEVVNLGVRTLQRKLKSEQTSYTDLLDEVKLSFAKNYLRDVRLSISEAAFLLGYNEISAFYHFFKRHTQLTPREFQQQD